MIYLLFHCTDTVQNILKPSVLILGKTFSLIVGVWTLDNKNAFVKIEIGFCVPLKCNLNSSFSLRPHYFLAHTPSKGVRRNVRLVYNDIQAFKVVEKRFGKMHLAAESELRCKVVSCFKTGLKYNTDLHSIEFDRRNIRLICL